MNTPIRLQNKAHGVLAAGLMPLASNTPNHGLSLRAPGPERFLFGSPASFYALLKRPDPAADFAFVAGPAMGRAADRAAFARAYP